MGSIAVIEGLYGLYRAYMGGNGRENENYCSII